MKIVRRPAALQRLALGWRRRGKTIGFVPTMGALHAGHLALAARARRENDVVVASVFVNPAQFGPKEDLARYPRPFSRDAALCRAAGVDALFAPSPAAMYPEGDDTRIAVEKTSAPLCGPFRPGHFRGVATVVAKLFNLALPTRAYFGEKDYQQLQVLRRMVKDLFFPLEVVPCPTERDAAGLALSSRNAYLSPAERAAAPRLARALRAAATALKNRRGAAAARKIFKKELGPSFRLQYFEIVDPVSLAPWRRGPARLAAAAYLGKTRLIDNLGVR